MRATAPEAAESLLAAGLAELGLGIDSLLREQLLALTGLLERWGQRINLSGHRSAEEIIRRLILDALAISTLLPSDLRSLADLGSGAGFPGLPIALSRPEVRILLVESRERRHHFQRAVIRELGLENVRAIRGRIEELAPIPVHVAIAQAVAAPAKVIAAMLPWVEPGGYLIIPGSETPPDPGPQPQLQACEIRRYRVPCGGPERTLWIGHSH